ncbi:MAG TPA: hypothetical protein VH478_03070 [Trebonia sp.]|jgi:hypothetical protein|nr:hypothetical protein [Trebonia sp.]
MADEVPASGPGAARPLLSYQVGNEHSPTDPWGRSELVIYPDGSARLDHYFSRRRPPGAWAGYVDAPVLAELLGALQAAGWPPAPLAGPLLPGAALRLLTVEAQPAAQSGGIAGAGAVEWVKSSMAPGHAVAFDIIDAVIRQLSRDAVQYPTKRGPVVHGAVPRRPGT